MSKSKSKDMVKPDDKLKTCDYKFLVKTDSGFTGSAEGRLSLDQYTRISAILNEDRIWSSTHSVGEAATQEKPQ